MPSKTNYSECGGACDAFMEALDGFICGLISLDRLRVTIATLLEGDFEPAEEMQETLDSTLREGYLDKSAYMVLSSVIELIISEEEPTESPRRVLVSPVIPSLPAAPIAPEYCAPEHSEPEHSEPEYSEPEESEAETPAEMAPGMTLRDRFTLLEQIGSGSVGKIFKAIDQRKKEAGSTTPWVAIKSISEALSNPPNAPVALQKEAANAQRLSHPNIIRVFDFDRDDDHVFMTMELLDGETLAELLNKHRFRPLPAEQARSIIKGLCHGLIYAHELGIVHADVKPGNVFVTHDGNTKLLDFGISLATNDHSQKSDVYAHTPSYASYEVLEGAEPAAQDDVYSLACVAYRILAGRRAYDGATAHAAQTENLELKAIENISTNEWTAICNAMAFQRADRTADVLSFLDEFSKESAVSASPDIDELEETHQAPAFTTFSPVASLCAALLIGITATIALWPDEEEKPAIAEVPISAVPARMNDTKPADVGPPATLRASKVVEPETTVIAAAPAQSKPKKKPAASARPEPKNNPLDELAKKADVSLNKRLLLLPAENSAKLYISKMQSIDPDASEFIQARQRFADLMMLEVMVAIADEDFDAADALIAETKSLGVESETTERYENALAKARETKSIQETNSMGAIFASTMPAAVLANPDYEQNPISRALATAMIDLNTENKFAQQQQSDPTEPVSAASEAADSSDAQSIDPTPETLPLSAFEFKRRVMPEYPPRAAGRKLSGWVDLRFLVNAQGKTENIEVTDSEPEGSFETAATKAISKWRFKPIMVDGLPAEKYGEVRLRFNP